MIKKAIAIAAVLSAALTVTVSAGAVPCCFNNGSFESDDLTGWSQSLTAGFASTEAGGAAGGGSFHARVGTGNSTTGVWQSISQTSFGPAGWIRGWVRNNGEDSGCDTAQVLVDGAVVFSETSATNWVKFGSYVSAGGHTITLRKQNGCGDNAFPSTVDLDAVIRDVRFAPAP